MTKQISEEMIMIKRTARVMLIVTVMLCTALSSRAVELTLDQALQIGFTKSPSIRQSQLSLDASQHNLEAQQASLKSQFSLDLTPFYRSKTRVYSQEFGFFFDQEEDRSSGSFSISQPLKWTDATLRLANDIDWRKTTGRVTNASAEETTYSNNLYLSFNQPLFTYNRTKLQLKELELALETAELNHAIQKLQIEFQVTQQFMNLYLSQRSVQIAVEEFDNATESYEIIASKVGAGISPQEELFQAELTQSTARANVQNTQMSYENALDDFKILLGLPLEEKISLMADVRKMMIPVDRKTAIDEGLANRMELRQRGIDIENALFDLIRTGSEDEFRADLQFTYGIIGTAEKFGDIFSNKTQNQSIGLTLNIPLFDWGRKKHRLAASNAGLDNSRINYEEQRRQIVTEIRRAHRSLLNQQTQIDIAEQNVKNARLTHEINLERYKNGDLSSKDMSFYQEQLSREQLGEVAALISYKIALLDIKILTLWDFEKNRSVLTVN